MDKNIPYLNYMYSKNFYFLCGLPRAGNTLLGSLLNQNKNIQVTGWSILPLLMANIYKIKETKHFKNFPYHQGIDNFLINIFHIYYSNVNAQHIIDRAAWGSESTLGFIKNIMPKRKFIILYRPLIECLASIVKLFPNEPHSICENVMGKDGIVSNNLNSIKNLIKEKENYIIIHYNDLVKNTQATVDKLLDFLNIPKFDIDFNNIKQLSIQNTFYDDSHLSANFHTIRTDEIKQIKYDVEKYLPIELIDKYSKLDIKL